MLKIDIRRLEGIFWVGIGFIICILAWRFDVGSFREPAAGFVAFLSGLFLCGIGIIMVISKSSPKSQANHRRDAVDISRIIPWHRLTFTVGLLLGYTLFLNGLGYLLSTLLLMYGMYFDWRKKNWTQSFLFSIVTVLTSYLVFEVWLHCQLPCGVFPWW
jgi:hypothetical protein